jgi:hypothetical protein
MFFFFFFFFYYYYLFFFTVVFVSSGVVSAHFLIGLRGGVIVERVSRGHIMHMYRKETTALNGFPRKKRFFWGVGLRGCV